MKRLAIILTHPIQYYVPIFKLLAKQCDLKVFYTWGEDGIKAKYDPGFGKTITWDLPLLEGYNYELLENIAKQPGSHHGKGIVNPSIIAKLKAFAPNAILVYGYSYHSHFKVMRHFKGEIPVWFRGDSTLLDEKFSLKALLKQIYLRWVYSYVDKAFYVGTQNKAYFKKYGLKENQLIFSPHAVDNERFAENRKIESIELREKLGIAENDILILFAGKLEPKKDPDLLLKAFVALTQNNLITSASDFSPFQEEMLPNQERGAIHLLFVGNGVLEEELKQKAKKYFDKSSSTLKNTEKLEFVEIVSPQLSVVNLIHFMDFQNQTKMPAIYQACDIFCLPSQGPGETWGLAVNEAMAAGKAVIASDKVGCAVDLVHGDKNGIIFKANSIDSLIAAIKTVCAKVLPHHKQTTLQIISSWTFEKQVEILTQILGKTN